MENMYEIIDNKGVVYSGNEDEMMETWQKIINGTCDYTEFTGDIKLVKVLGIHK